MNIRNFLTTGLLALLTLTACSTPASTPSANEVASPPAGTSVEYTLLTGESEGRMVYIGVGGEIDGMVNPDLFANPGDTVRLIMVIGDGILHDLALPDLNAQSEAISKKNDQTEVVFQVTDAGEFVYYCTLPGHRQAGMEGRLIVADTGASAQDAAPAEIPQVSLTSVVRAPNDLPPALNQTEPRFVQVVLETVEVDARLADGSSFRFWTFNGKVPGPFVRVRVGDTVEVVLKNAADSQFAHSVDFHAVTGPGGGAVATQTKPGEETTFTFKALSPGLFVYHCATPMVAHHIANGMYGLILVEPEGGLDLVDHEFYVMQGEIYTAEPYATQGALSFDVEKLLDEQPEYLIFNGAVDALTASSPLLAQTGETVRIFFGVGGPNLTSSFHVIGEIFDKVYDLASLTSAPLTDVQTTLVPPGGAVVVEFALQVPGRYLLVDHALSRLERGLVGFLLVEGPEKPEVFQGEMTGGSGH
jgi:nitrite reductase (NO-forming)